MKILLLMCLLNYAFNAEYVHTQCDVEGFYWRDYTGNIPSDALPGGTDDKGNLIYIGQALFPLPCTTVPGLIRSTTKIMTLEMLNKEERGTQDIKILCTVHPEHFQWIQTNENVKPSTLLKGKQQFIITTGFDNGSVIIGRALVGDEILVGKIKVRSDDTFFGIHIGKGGQGIQVTSFEVLVYDPTLSECKERGGSGSGSKTFTVNIF